MHVHCDFDQFVRLTLSFVPPHSQIAEFAKCAGKTIRTTPNARMERAPMSTRKKNALRESSKRRCLMKKFLSMSSTDKYIQGMLSRLTYVDVCIRRTRSFCMFFLFHKTTKNIFLQSIAQIACILYILRGHKQKCAGKIFSTHSKLCHLAT